MDKLLIQFAFTFLALYVQTFERVNKMSQSNQAKWQNMSL